MTDRPKHDDPLAGLMARALADSASGGTDCPDAEILAAYFERSLAGEETSRWELHFSTCGRCQEQLGAMVRMEPAVPTEQPAPAGSSWFWNWRWLAPAAAALGVVTLWVVTRTPDSSIPVKAPVAAVAENRAAPPAEAAAAKEPGAEELSTSTKATVDRVDPMSQPAQAGTGARSQDAPKQFPPVLAPGAAGFTGLRSQAGAAPATGRTDAARQLADDQAVGQEKRAVALLATERKDKPAAPEAAAETAATQKPAAPAIERDDKLAQQAEANVAQPAEADRNVLSNEALNRANTAGEATKKKDAGAFEAANQFRERDEAMLKAGRTRAEEGTPRYKTVMVPGSSVLWRLGAAGSIEMSADGGANWQKQTSGVSVDLLAGSAPSAEVCWVVGRGGVVLRTSDGKNWTQLGSPASLDLIAVEATDANKAVVTTGEGKRYQTSDGGRTWRSL